jgi:hypothetical protein
MADGQLLCNMQRQQTAPAKATKKKPSTHDERLKHALADLVRIGGSHYNKEDNIRSMSDEDILAAVAKFEARMDEAQAQPNFLAASCVLLGIGDVHSRLDPRLEELDTIQQATNKALDAKFDISAVYYQALRNHMVWNGDAESLRLGEFFAKMMCATSRAYDHVVSALGLRGAFEASTEPSAFGPFEDASVELGKPDMLSLERADLNASETLYAWLVIECGRRGLTRKGNTLFKEAVLKYRLADGSVHVCRTGAWEEYYSIKDFIYEMCSFTTNLTAWHLLNDNSTSIDRICKMLETNVSSELPQLEREHDVFAFLGHQTKRTRPAAGAGLYYLSTDRFVPFLSEDGEVAPVVHAGMVYHLPFPLETLEGEPREFDDIDADVDPRIRAEPWFAADPMAWPTPIFDSIFERQGLLSYNDAPTQGILHNIYALLGRCLFPLGTHDTWQTIPFFQGIAGTGKSTVGKVMQLILGDDRVGIVPNTIESPFGLESIYDRALWMCLEVKKSLRLDQGTFQSMCSGEQVTIAQKYKAAKSVVWSAPGLLFGNEYPPYIDASGSISRRIILIEFMQALRAVDSDPRLVDRLLLELPTIIRKMNLIYRQFAARHHDADIWAVLHPYFIDRQKHMRSTVSPIIGFLESGDAVTITDSDDNRIRLHHFIRLFRDWMKCREIKGQVNEDEVKRALGEAGCILKNITSQAADGSTTTQSYVLRLAQV